MSSLVTAGTILPAGLSLPDDLTRDQWLQVGKDLRRMESGVMWWLGDWLRYGEQRKWEHGKYEEARKLGFAVETARGAAWVAEKFETVRRITVLNWSHHQVVAGLDPADADRLLAEAGREKYSVNELREQVRIFNLPPVNAGNGCTADDLDALIKAGKRFGAILADPPWEYKVYSGLGKSRSAESNYKPESPDKATQSIDELKAMPIANLAADDCALFLWSVMPELPGAIEVMNAWGFKYKTVAFAWVKTTENSKLINLDGDGLHWGMGYWTRANVELCLFGTKGAPKRRAMDVHQVIVSQVGEHSRKPQAAHERIERLLSGPYLELYARRPMAGWTAWGNEIVRDLFHQSIPEFEAAE